MTVGETKDFTCLNCGDSAHQRIYRGKIRSGEHGHFTKDEQSVFACEGCGLARLEVFEADLAYYESEAYREDYNADVSAKGYLDAHAAEQPPRLDRIGSSAFENKTVLDFGCGGGAFLDLVKPYAQVTIGIEPFSGFHASPRSRGHQVFGGDAEALKEWHGKVDVMVSFGVIEHTGDPAGYLTAAMNLLRPGGVLYIETDNLDDILMKAGVPEFEQFFYRTAHLWYFTGDTLAKLCRKIGFQDIAVGHRHNFDVSNTMMWLRDGRPTGYGALPLFDDLADQSWKDMIERLGYADLIHAKVVKPS